MIKTKLTELLGIEYPIVQSGMQWLAVPQLAAAVCNAGGIGTINVTCWPTLDEFADALDEMNSLTSKPYIVNISLAPTQRLDNEEIRKTIKLCGEKHVAAIETSAEDPREFIADIKSAGMRHFHKCPNYKVSMSMERKELDGVIIAGYEVGGHLGRRCRHLRYRTPLRSRHEDPRHRRRRHNRRSRSCSSPRFGCFRRCNGHTLCLHRRVPHFR